MAYIRIQWIIIFLGLCLVKGDLILDNTDTPCPGELVSLTCTVESLLVVWDLPHSTNDIDIIVGTTAPIQRDQFTLTFINQTNSTTISRLTFPAADGVTVGCYPRFMMNQIVDITIQVADDHIPNSPTMITHSLGTSLAKRFSVTVQWDSVDGADNYTVTISPPAQLSATVITSTSVNVSAANYNVTYTVSVVATNCAGNSTAGEYSFRVATCPSSPTPAGVTINSVPSVPVEGSTLSFTCTLTGEGVVSTCGSDGLWSSDPGTYPCPTTAPPVQVTCDPPGAPSMGSVNTDQQSYTEGSVVTFQCDPDLFPPNGTATCTRQGQTGVWEPDPGSVVCRTSPANCTLPPSPVNGSIDNYDDFNETVVEETVLIYQCDDGFIPTGPSTIICTNAGQWSSDPTCTLPTTPPPVSSGNNIGGIAGGVVGGILIVILIATVIIVIVWLVWRERTNPKSSEEGIEMKEDRQAEYSELRHDGPKRGSKKTKATPAGSDGYNKIAHSRQIQGPYDDIDVKNTSDGPEGYSTVNNGQGAQRLPGYGQLGNVATVEPVVYADLGVQPRKKRSDAPEVDQHTVTYATVDMAATEKMKASTMPGSTKSAVSAEQADKLLNLDQALVQLRPVQSRWQELAEALRVPETLIQQIADSYGKDPANAMTEVVDHWMRSCGRPTWRELADALNRIKEKGLAKQFMSVYDTGRLPVELDMNEVPKEMYKYDDAPPPPVPTRSPTITDTESPGLSRTLPPMRPPKYGGDAPPSRPPKPPPKDVSPTPPRPPKPPRQ